MKGKKKSLFVVNVVKAARGVLQTSWIKASVVLAASIQHLCCQLGRKAASPSLFAKLPVHARAASYIGSSR